jgi:hypothetical protein
MSLVQIDTGKVTDRRSPRFADSRDLLADVERVAAAERRGVLRRTGNWTVGQILGHLAAWASFPYEGYPPELNPPWFVKFILRFQKNRFLHRPMPHGVKIPGVEGGTKGLDVLSLDEGLARLRSAWQRLDAGPPTRPNPIFGPLTHDEWKQLNLRHAELHLSYLHPA